jgi:hypothetical protein
MPLLPLWAFKAFSRVNFTLQIFLYKPADGLFWPTYRFSVNVQMCLTICRSQCARGLRHCSSSTRLLGLRVRISPGAWMSSLVSVVYCHVQVSTMDWSLVQGSPTECGVFICEASIMRRPWTTRGCRGVGGSLTTLIDDYKFTYATPEGKQVQ